MPLQSLNNFTTVLENDSGNDQNALVTETIKSIQLNGMCLSLLLHHIECFQTHARFIFFYYFFGYFFLVISLFSLPLGIQTKSTIIVSYFLLILIKKGHLKSGAEWCC